MEKIKRVNLFLIGVNKAGSSWVYYVLNEHPQIFMSKIKELYYFGDKYPQDLKEYHASFDFEKDYQYYGEATPTYYRKKRIAEEIIDYSPNAKIIAVVRDPIKRMYSQFYYHKQLGILEEDTTIEEAINGKDPHLLSDSHYEVTLPNYSKIFGTKCFHLVSLEQMIENSKQVWKKLQTFLNIQKINFPEARQQSENATGSPIFRKVYRSTIRPIKKNKPELYKRLLRSKSIRLTKKFLLNNLGKSSKKSLNKETLKRLYEEFAPTYKYLEEEGFGKIYNNKMSDIYE